MKKLLFGKKLYSLLIPVVILFSSATTADKVDFSGNWKLDESKSDLGNFGGFVARSFKVEQKNDAITFTKTTPGFNGGDPVTLTYTLSYDGKVTEAEGFGGSKIKYTAKMSEDGKTLIVNSNATFERDGQTNEFKSTETWTITKDGLLSVETQTSSSFGESTTKAIYTK